MKENEYKKSPAIQAKHYYADQDNKKELKELIDTREYYHEAVYGSVPDT